MDKKISIITDNIVEGQKFSHYLNDKGFITYISMNNADSYTQLTADDSTPDLVIINISDQVNSILVLRQLQQNSNTTNVVKILCVKDENEKNSVDKYANDTLNIIIYNNNLSEIFSIIRECLDISSAADKNIDTDHISNDPVLNDLAFQTLKLLSDIVEMKDSTFKGHAKRTANYAKMLAARLGANEEKQIRIYCAALLHDIGMINIPNYIAAKKGMLSPDEKEKIKEHVTAGSKLVKSIPDIPEIKSVIRSHHERYDGMGYPDGLKYTDIPYAARIVAVAEAYDAMTSERAYRGVMPQQLVREEFVKGIGTQFDPDVAKEMLLMINEDKEYKNRQLSKEEWKILIVDDDPMVIRTASFILNKQKQYRTVTANSGSEALSILKSQSDIDLVLLDIEMPVMNGIETLELIRENDTLSEIPVIFVTADNTRDTFIKLLQKGVNGYITKPFAPNYFLAKIQEVIDTL